ncbi:uncharacterized protein LOC141719829 [Apium graveolens]|uniref:uncharacterized protein LOC141719829 n=1 Tax=Apium graveolens TaxID=4045 RepID=UPI003D7A5B4E
MDLHCWCGRAVVLRTSWTDANPGRRFWGCFRYMEQRSNACNFHLWFDPPMCQRSRMIIPGLLRRIEKLEEEAEKLEVVVAGMKTKRGRNVFIYVTVFMLLIFVLVMKNDGEVVVKRQNKLV